MTKGPRRRSSATERCGGRWRAEQASTEVRRLLIGLALAGGLAAVVGISYLVVTPDGSTITGVVVGSDGQRVAGAVVRIQATPIAVQTDDSGRFEIPVPNGSATLTAWAPGYFVGGGDLHQAGAEVELAMAAIPAGDNQDYEWLSVDAPLEGGTGGCVNCHSSDELEFPLPVDEWRLDAHGTSAHNELFRTMYAGTDVEGRQSPLTRFVVTREYGSLPLPPDPSVPYYGPGFALDFPDTFGNCASCHLPMAAANDPYGVDPLSVSGVAAEGVGCDYCHKVSDVITGSDGLPLANRPGVLSTEWSRPPDGHQFFAGPFDDVPGEDTFSALYLDSRMCASCHHGVFWETVVYDSYGEWLRSDYSDPVVGQTCQDCHMPPSGATLFALPEVGGVERDPATIASHLMPGAADAELLRSALTMDITTQRNDGVIDVEVQVSNRGAGHHVPTDSPLRHVILVLEGRDDAGGALELVAGPVLPEWCGVGDPADGYYAGLPGTAYAKVLEELWTEVSPTGAYWNPTRVLSDNRIAANDSDTTSYSFAASGATEVTVRLLYRRAFAGLADQKGWDLEDIEMARAVVRP